MNCSQTGELFAADAEGLLDETKRRQLETHLSECPACRVAVDETRGLIDRLERSGRYAVATSIAGAVVDRIVHQQALQLRRYTAMKRVIPRVSIAAALLVGVALALSHPIVGPGTGRAYADDLSAARHEMETVKTATWKTSFYQRFLSRDRRRSKWVRMGNSDKRYFYKAPGLYRLEILNEDGRVVFVSIEDVRLRAKLDLVPSEKAATIAYLAESKSYSPRGPFATFTEAMKSNPLHSLGKRNISGQEADGYRYEFFVERANRNWSYEFWLDPKTKRLVTGQVPGGDIFDTTEIVRDKVCDASKQTIEVGGETFTALSDFGMGGSSSLVHDITYGAVLDDSLFSPEPPKGYAIKTVRLPKISEQDVTDFLGVVAEYFDKTFPDRMPYFNSGPKEYDRFEKIESDVLAGKERTTAETNIVKAMWKWWNTGIPGPGPLHAFITWQIDEGSWKYLGKGVKLGDKSQIVCWYRPKGSRTYRVVYGDLSIRDVAPEDLPLPVGR